MGLLRVNMTGSPVRMHADTSGGVVEALGILGLDISAREVNGSQRTVVQLLLDDTLADAGKSLLESPLIAELVAPPSGDSSQQSAGSAVENEEQDPASEPSAGKIVARELFDHDRFRRKLHEERQAGESVTAGVLVLTGGELPASWIRLAFLPVPLKMTPGLDLVIRRTSVPELVAGVDQAYSKAELTDDQRRHMLISIEQYHPEEV